jgi:hypothetical protein
MKTKATMFRKFGHQLSSRIQSSNNVEEAEESAAIFFENNRFLQSWNDAVTDPNKASASRKRSG